MKVLDHPKNTLAKQDLRRRLEKIIISYEGSELKDVDKNLIKGLVNRVVEDDHSRRDEIMNTIKKYIMKKLIKKGLKKQEINKKRKNRS
jgi:hypothetical protein